MNNEQISEQIEQIAPSMNIHEQVHEVDAESFELVTMAEAARRMKMPYPTLRRQVNAGKIPSTPGPDGKPMVKFMATEQIQNSREQKTNKTEQNAPENDYSLTIQCLLKQMDVERSYAKALNEKLEAANHRNGYLEAQVDQQSEQIKLLSDRHPKRGGWTKFWSWFTGS